VLPFVFKGTARVTYSLFRGCWMVTFKNEESELSFQGLAPRSPEENALIARKQGFWQGDLTCEKLRKKINIKQDWCQRQREKGPKTA
jgi:hypothetical protein